ncbi:MAG TPA: PA14 domain-containing protein [Polyangiaceae bacterium]|nr:PA14 domain-containing protein [Polyangiaceae bacterium]
MARTSFSSPRSRWRVAIAVFSPAVVAGCPGTLENPERFERASSSSAVDCAAVVVPQLLSNQCAVSGCHSATNPAQGLDHASPNVLSRLVGIDATGAGCAGELVVPGDPSSSLLYTKLTSSPPCGERMPFLGAPVSSTQLACVGTWIAGLVPDGGVATDASAPGTTSPVDASTRPTDTGADARVMTTNMDGGGTVALLPDTGAPRAAGLTGEYFDGSDYTSLKLTRVDPFVDFTWSDSQSPDPTIAADGNYSARWTGFVTPEFDETYTFYTTSDDGVKLTLAAQVVVDDETLHSPTEDSGTIALTAGSPVALELDWYNAGGAGTIVLSWSSPSTAKEIVPASQLSHE